MKNKGIVILLVEDEEAHAILTMRALEDAQVAKDVHWVADGVEAMDYLFRHGTYADENTSPRPDLILLDLRLPKLDGHEVLKAIKESGELRDIPVVILTTSESDADMIKAYSNYANSYLVKPVEFNKFRDMIRDMDFYWLAWNQHLRKDVDKTAFVKVAK